MRAHLPVFLFFFLSVAISKGDHIKVGFFDTMLTLWLSGRKDANLPSPFCADEQMQNISFVTGASTWLGAGDIGDNQGPKFQKEAFTLA